MSTPSQGIIPNRTLGPRPTAPAGSIPDTNPSGLGTLGSGNYAPLKPKGPTGTTGLTADQQSAKASIDATLGAYGLSSLGDFAWKEYLAGVPVAQVMLDIRNRPEYKARFPAMAQLAAEGRAISEGQYIGFEQSASAVFQKYGLPKTFFDQPADFARFLTGDVSIAELDTRVGLASQAAVGDPMVRDALARIDGVSAGDLTAYYLDPNKALPLLQRNANAADVLAASNRTGYGDVGVSGALSLAEQGVSGAQAQQGFGTLAADKQLFTGLAGTTETGIDQQVQLGAAFGGNAADQEVIRRRAAERAAQFQGGGSVSGSSSKGASGLSQAG